MDMISVQSSQIAQIGHDGQSLLRVLFRRGGLYEYQNVTSEEFTAFREAESIGTHFAQHIKGAKTFAKLEGTPMGIVQAPTEATQPTVEVPTAPKSEPVAPLPAEAQAVSKKSTELTVQASAIQVSNPETQQQASDILLTVAAMRKEIADTFKPMKDAAFKSHRTICDQEKTLDAPLAEAERTLKSRIGSYVMEQRKIAREAEETLRKAEQERAEQEAREEGERLALNDAIALEAAGDTKAAEAVLANPAPAPVRYVAPAPVAPSVASASGVSIGTDWDFRILNEALIPREYLLVNESAIRSLGKTTKGKAKIAGIEFYEKPVVAASRTARTA